MTGMRRKGALTLALGLAAGVALLAWLDWNSMERGNRLYREGRVSDAVAVYRSVSPGSLPRQHYNLGTALLSGDFESALEQLEVAAAGADSAASQRASRNLSAAYLGRVDPSLEPDSAAVLLAAAVDNGRAAIRLDPHDEDARWNLALSQQMLDSVSRVRRAPTQEERAGNDPTRIEDAALTRSGQGDGASGLEPEDPRQAENTGQRFAAAQGAREALASLDPGPLSAGAALGLIQPLADDPEGLIRGMLWSHRPDVAWWASERYPGGDW